MLVASSVLAAGVLAAETGGWIQLVVVVLLVIFSVASGGAKKKKREKEEADAAARLEASRRARPPRVTTQAPAHAPVAPMPQRSAPSNSVLGDFSNLASTGGSGDAHLARGRGSVFDTAHERPAIRPVRVQVGRRKRPAAQARGKGQALGHVLPAFDGPEMVRAIVLAEILNAPAYKRVRGAPFRFRAH